MSEEETEVELEKKKQETSSEDKLKEALARAKKRQAFAPQVFEYTFGQKQRPAHASVSAPLQENRFLFKPNEILFQYLYDDDFRKHVDEGKYIFANGSLVLKDVRFVTIYHGRFAITRYGKKRPSICCVSKVSAGAAIQHGESHGGTTVRDCEELHEPLAINSITDLTPDVIRNILGGTGGRGYFPYNFCLALTQFMREKRMTEEGLAENSCLSTKTIQRMRNDESYQPTLESVIAVCIGLHLDPRRCYFLIQLSGNTTERSKEAGLYDLIISMAYKIETTVRAVNHVLIACDVSPLTRDIDE